MIVQIFIEQVESESRMPSGSSMLYIYCAVSSGCPVAPACSIFTVLSAVGVQWLQHALYLLCCQQWVSSGSSMLYIYCAVSSGCPVAPACSIFTVLSAVGVQWLQHFLYIYCAVSSGCPVAPACSIFTVLSAVQCSIFRIGGWNFFMLKKNMNSV